MNILPKKRWHVRTKQNIERVRRDEAKAAEEEKELKRKIQLAEQEARTEFLRKKAKGSGEQPKEAKEETNYDSKSNTSIYNDKDKHVNFFKEIEESGGYVGGTNKEHEAEEKATKEKFEKDIGLLTYLGQSSIEAKGQTPWYLKSSSKDIEEDSEKKDEEKSKKHKAYLDPLNTINKFLDIKRKNSECFEMKSTKDKSSDKAKNSDSSNTKNMTTIEILRAKRLKREEEERRRSQEFLKNLRGEKSSKPEVIYDDRLRKYNSQFNPHLAKNSAIDRNRQYPS